MRAAVPRYTMLDSRPGSRGTCAGGHCGTRAANARHDAGRSGSCLTGIYTPLMLRRSLAEVYQTQLGCHTVDGLANFEKPRPRNSSIGGEDTSDGRIASGPQSGSLHFNLGWQLLDGTLLRGGGICLQISSSTCSVMSMARIARLPPISCCARMYGLFVMFPCPCLCYWYCYACICDALVILCYL